MPEGVRRERLLQASQHLECAKTEREYYREQSSAAKVAFSRHLETKEAISTMHYPYDFAQQVHFPFDAQQTGPAYFKTARKCGIFGVTCDGKAEQVNYLIDEAENPGKGADCTISLVHHYLENYGCAEDNLVLHADNCTGQNKNNATIQYLLWRVMTGEHKTAQISFMLAGHTKFAPDRFFGLFKKRFRRSSVDTIADICRVVQESTSTGQNKYQVIRSLEGKKLVNFFKWTEFLQQFFKHLPNLLTYHCFQVDAAKPGLVMVRQYSNTDEISINILRIDHQAILMAEAPQLLPGKGLDPQRQWYLYEQIRPFCKSTLSADFTCPEPTVLKPGRLVAVAPSNLPVPPTGTASKRKYSACGVPGHTKRTCPGSST